MSTRMKHFISISSILLFMSFLYIKTESLDLNAHGKLLNNFNQFLLVDSSLNQNILEIRQGLISFYDPTVGKTSKLNELTLDIENILNNTHKKHKDELTLLIVKLKSSLKSKQNFIEKFKSTNSIFINSLRYLPTATRQLTEKLPLNSQGDTVTLLLTEQLRDILILNQSNDKHILDKFNETNKSLNILFNKSYPMLLGELHDLQAHANIIIKNKKLIDNIVINIIRTETSKTANKLLSAYLSIHSNATLEIERYQQALYALSFLLIFYIAYILFKLNVAGTKLNKTIKDLNYQKFAMDQHAIVSITDSEGNIIYANEKFCEISGYSFAEITGKNHSIIISDKQPESLYERLKQTSLSGEVWHGTIHNKNKNHEHYWVDTTCVPFLNQENKTYQIVTIQTNITEIKEAQEQLHLQAAALEVAPNGIIITDKNSHILWANHSFTRITGYDLDDVINKNSNILSSGKQDAAFYKKMWKDILNGKPWHGELINRRKDGSLYPEEITIAPVINTAGDISHFVSIKQDISKRRLTEEALRRSQKLDAIGQLSGGIAHDFNNQLGIIIGYLDIIKLSLHNNDEASKFIDISTKSALRCVELTRQLLAFSSNQTSEASIVNLNQLLQDQKAIASRSITPEINIEYELDTKLWATETNSGEFQDAILNMTFNARDAMPHGGTLTIKTNNITIQNDNHIIDGDYARLIISDTGIGMSKETLEHVFEPFFTTKAIDKGTGLGMSMVYGFVKRNGGFIHIESDEGIGTAITIHLPRANSNVLTKFNTEPNQLLPEGNETILIVDDESDLLRLANKYLKSFGYKTYTANNAKQALDILNTKTEIQMLFSDVVMPGGINGYELAKKARADNPQLKVLLSSGFTSQPTDDIYYKKLSENLLKKPYRKSDLAFKIRNTLDNDY